MPRDPALDGLRGIAILGVVGYHAGWLPGGWAGVNLFFALSGYLITSLLLGEWARTRELDLRRFWTHRLARLLPSSVMALVGLLGITWMLHPHDVGEVAFGALVVLGYAANVAVVWHPFPQTRWAWSLSLEEQFYVLWPVVLVASLRRGASRAAISVGAVALACALGVGRALVSGAHPDWAYALVRGDELLLGCVLALLGVRLAGGWGVLATALLAGMWLFADPRAGAVTLSGLDSVVLVGAVAGGFARPVLAWAPLRLLGRISYALYLWSCGLGAALLQYPGNRVLAVWLTSSVVLAWVSTRYVEEPVRAWARARRRSVGALS